MRYLCKFGITRSIGFIVINSVSGFLIKFSKEQCKLKSVKLPSFLFSRCLVREILLNIEQSVTHARVKIAAGAPRKAIN